MDYSLSAYCCGREVDLVEHIVHSVEIGNGGGDGQVLTKIGNRIGHKKVDKGTGVLTNEICEGKLGLSK